MKETALNGTILERIKAIFESLTRAERQLAGAILDNYPMSGLGSITRLAENADVSTPTVARMVQKLGYSGFPDFQEALKVELAARISDPIAKHEHWANAAPEAHLLNRFTDMVIQNIRQSLAQIDPAHFDAATALLVDPDRQVFVTGGRITHALAKYFHLHMDVMRKGVGLIEAASSTWPHGLLDMDKGDVLVVYDIRRYENGALKLAEMAAGRGVEIILMTDQWQSPVRRFARYSFNCRIEVPSAWDSTVALMLLSETFIAAVQEASWDETKRRMNALETMFDETRIFRKFV